MATDRWTQLYCGCWTAPGRVLQCSACYAREQARRLPAEPEARPDDPCLICGEPGCRGACLRAD